MKIYCEIPDDVVKIMKEFLLISREGDQSVGQHMALYIARHASHGLRAQWRRLDREMPEEWGGKKKTQEEQEEIESKVDILEKFCREREGL